MATADIDVVEGSRLKRTTDGWTKTRIARVYGLEGDEAARELEALQSVPSLYSTHPNISFIRLMEQRVRSIAPDHVEVILTYRTPTGDEPIQDEDNDGQIEIGGTLESVRTDQDKDGNLLTVDYSGDSDYDPIPTHVVEVDLQRATFHYRRTRLESITALDLLNLNLTYAGKVNANAVLSGDARTWMMGPIIGRSDDGGQTWLVRYEAFYNPDTWDAVVKAEDPESGQIPSGVTDGDGRETYPVLSEVDFGPLNL